MHECIINGCQILCKQLHFYFYVYFEDLPQAKNPRALCQGNSPNFICSHDPMEIFLFYEIGKKWRNKKRVVYVRGPCTHALSWGLGTSSSSRPWVPLPQENTLGHEPLLQQNHLDNIMTQALGENDNFLGMFTVVNIDDYTNLGFNFYVVKWGNIDFEKLLI